jgi:hypothetical protein
MQQVTACACAVRPANPYVTLWQSHGSHSTTCNTHMSPPVVVQPNIVQPNFPTYVSKPTACCQYSTAHMSMSACPHRLPAAAINLKAGTAAVAPRAWLAACQYLQLELAFKYVTAHSVRSSIIVPMSQQTLVANTPFQVRVLAHSTSAWQASYVCMYRVSLYSKSSAGVGG